MKENGGPPVVRLGYAPAVLRRPTVVAILATLCVLTSAASVDAQANEGVRLDRLRPPPSSSDGLGMPLASTVGHLIPSFGLVLDYALQPLVARSTNVPSESGAIVAHRVTAHVLGALGVTDRLEFHLRVPVVFQAGDSPTVAGVRFGAPDVATLSDPALGGSVRILGEPTDIYHLGAMLEVFFPFADASGYASDREVSFRGLALFDLALTGLTVELMAGASYRPERQLVTARTASELDVSLGLKIPAFVGTDAFAELHLSSGLRDDLFFQAQGTALELLVGGRYRHAESGLAVELGVGVGFLRAPGVPAFRGFAGIRWEPVPPPPPNTDGDALLDADDECPTEAEDADGWQDDDGCPDPDDDEDGLLDADDPCPRAIEDMDGWLDGDGCPDEDDDGDGLADADDTCPRAPGPESSRGCPVTIEIEGSTITLVRDIDFQAGEATLVPTDGPILDEIAMVMVLDQSGARWRVEVRPSRAGRRDDGAALALDRARAIVSALVLRDVPEGRLEAAAASTDADEFVHIVTLESSGPSE